MYTEELRHLAVVVDMTLHLTELTLSISTDCDDVRDSQRGHIPLLL